MTAEQRYSPAAQAVINDYLNRLEYRLPGFPPVDREDLLGEIMGPINESFAGEMEGEEMDRLLRVLRRLGEPSDVISERMSPAMIRMGKKKGLPFYILAGMLIAFVGLPLGSGAAGIIIGALAMIFGLLLAYFATALSFLVSRRRHEVGMGTQGLIPGLLGSLHLQFGTSAASAKDKQC